MKKQIFTAIACLAAVATIGSLAACGEKEPPKPTRHEHSYVNGVCECGDYEVDFLNSLPMAQDLQAACDQQGTVVDFTYQTRSYALEAADDSDEQLPITKTVQVYLPYGYDEAKQYDILYLMHGAGETYSYWLTKMGTTTRNVLDNMIKAGKCDPVIIVTPTVYSYLNTTEEQPEAETLAEGEQTPAEDEGQGETVNADWTTYFPVELRNDLVPAIEQEYSTYAGGDVSAENLKATREHRGFAGFSMGSVTTIEVLKQCPDMFSYFGSFSAGSDGAAVKEALSSDEFKDLDFGYWFNMNGTADFALEGHQELVAYVKANMTDKFTDGVNYAYIEVPGGSHAYNCWIEGLYNSLLVFFK